MKKTLNVLGIIMAWILSIALVLMLIAAPVWFSTLSLWSAETITDAVVGMLAGGQEAEPSAEAAQIVTLSETDRPASVEDVGKDVLAGIFGDSISSEQASAILSSKTVKQLVQVYIDDLTSLTGESNFNADKVKSIINKNIDDLVDVLQTNVPQLADMSRDELKTDLQKAVDEGAEQIVQSIPKPEEIRQQAGEDEPLLHAALSILARKNTIKLAIIGAIVVLSVLIFLCRLPGFRGFRWLATDLFVGAGFGAFTSIGLVVSSTAVEEIAKQSGQEAAGMVSALLSSFTNGMFIRTGVMLVAGGLLLAAYIFIKKQKAKGLQTAEMPVVEASAGEEDAQK